MTEGNLEAYLWAVLGFEAALFIVHQLNKWYLALAFLAGMFVADLITLGWRARKSRI